MMVLVAVDRDHDCLIIVRVETGRVVVTINLVAPEHTVSGAGIMMEVIVAKAIESVNSRYDHRSRNLTRYLSL